MQKLETEFLQSGGDFKLVRIEDVLEWQQGIAEINPLHIPDLTVPDGEKFPYYGQSTTNNGLIAVLSLDEKVLNNKQGKPTLLIHSNNQHIAYLESPFYLKDGHGATSVLQHPLLNKESALYLSAVIGKVIRLKFDYNAKATKIALKNTEIEVPVKNNNIDFDYMQSYVRELQLYLQSTGLSSYELTEGENFIINGDIEWKEFLIEDIFDIRTSKKRFDANKITFSGKYPYVARGDKNNGIRGYITEDTKYLNSGATISFGQDTATMFYQEKDYFTGDKIKIFVLRNGTLNHLNSQFIISAMRKSFSIFSWGSMFNEKALKETKIKLPIKENQPNYDYMETYIKTVQKLVIKDVVEFAEKELKAYQQVIG